MFNELRRLSTTDADRAFLAKVEAGVSEFEPSGDEYIRLVKEGKLDQIPPIAARTSGYAGQLDSLGREFRDQQLKLLTEAQSGGIRSSRGTRSPASS